MPKGKYTLSIRDFDSERGSVSFDGVVINDTNYATQDSLMDALKNAIFGVTLGILASEVRVFEADDLSQLAPDDEFAQRESVWVLTLIDATENKRFTRTIPCADLDLLNEAETDPYLRKSLDLTAGAGLALKTTVEAYARSPYGNTVILERVTHGGRNN